MANKPAQICQLQKGQLIDTQEGFVDTFNWAVQSIANLKGGENCEVTWPLDDHPTIDCTPEEDEDGESGGGGEYSDLSAVYDVIEDDLSGNDGITIKYTDGREDKFIPFPLSSDLSAGVEIFGYAHNSTGVRSDFTFISNSDSNVRFYVGSDGEIKLGVYYI